MQDSAELVSACHGRFVPVGEHSLFFNAISVSLRPQSAGVVERKGCLQTPQGGAPSSLNGKRVILIEIEL